MTEVVCPPYDVISPAEQAMLHERHPNNAVRLELATDAGGGEAKYRNAATAFRDWTAAGILKVDESPAMYVYRQDFVAPTGERRRVVGVIGSLRLEEFGVDSGVLPHEQTMPGPKEDRLALLRALGVNVSPIYAIYRGGGGLSSFYESLTHRPTAARVVDEAGTLHRLWVVSAGAEIELLAAATAPGPLVIADGHHRYETALAWHAANPRPGGHEGIMCFAVDADSEGIVVLPYNRAFKTAASPDETAAVLVAQFGGRTIEPDDALEELAASTDDHPFVFVLPDSYMAAGVSDADVIRHVGERAAAWRALDVVALHEALVPELWPAGVEDVTFSKDPEDVAHLVAKEWSVGVLLRSLKPAQVVDVARSGERMPQKASYFWPKAVTGLVFRSLR